MKFKPLVLIYGAGEMGSAVAHRLHRAKFRVIISAKEDPLTLMRGNAFSQAIYADTFEVDGVAVRKAVVTEA
ncbi:MAG: molybdenum hydroxylase, partial [Planctomycetes bacterium]|nr:molybdenum hydroxylase [Planctomycetota bacterium]